MILLYILLALLFLSVLIFYLIYRGFKNPVNPHSKTPKGFDFQVNAAQFPSVRGGDICAWQVEQNPNRPTLIMIHGWGRNVERMSPYFRKFYPLGYNLLAFDARGHGNSHAEENMNVVKFTEDISSAIDYVLGRPEQKNKNIFLIGLSIGGAASILAASRDKRVGKVITVGAFAHPLEVMRKQLSSRFIPYFPFTYLFFKYLKRTIKIDFDAIAPVNNIGQVEAQILLVHGKDDKIVPLEQGRKLQKAQPKAELWEISGRGHSNCHLESGFWERLAEFLLKEEVEK
jgi:pimeloyl-ACP methyl ester carboxylesterase